MCCLNYALQSSLELSSILTKLAIQSPTPTLKSKKASKAPAKGQLDDPLHSDTSSSSSDGAAIKKKKRGPNKRTSSKNAHKFDKKWQLHMTRNIMLDGELHLRILRYEVRAVQTYLDS